MGDFAVANAGASTAREDVTAAVPPQLVARWAAIAGERALLGFLPNQVRTA
ncbi:hypothetical protein [Actinotalea sp. Marseille-Q4924]|uniref:hypothetical protein n=1 Tax=Actinotalea sp. Marseille-Q4924 TaxID=2866571 RepID=UPI001CE4006D|nr:hypothetical protein [Actinotalea sp. Marseille-Q4924]